MENLTEGLIWSNL